ncbi:MAG: DinB family protein [Candidatus Eiseniibacteriota bacterium]
MSDVLVDAFRHSAWAMKTLIAACEGLSAEELNRPVVVCGSILATLNHLVLSDGGYVASLGGGRASWARDGGETDDLRELVARVEESSGRWERLITDRLDGERLVYLDDGAYETHASVVVVQALHHVAAHGEQVRAGLKVLGFEPPDVQPWALADATGRSRWLRPEG